MNNTPRQALRKIIAKYGNDLASDRRRVEGLLKDLSGEFRREINVLTNALEERVPLDLLAAAKSTPRELLLTKLTKRLEDNLGLTKEASNWAVDSWALALGVLTDAEVTAKEKKQSEIPSPPVNKPIQSTSAQNNKTAASRNTSTQFQTPQNQPKPQPKIYPPSAPRSPQTLPNKPPPPKVYPPVARPPVNLPTPAPKSPPLQRQPPSGSQINYPQNSAQSNITINNSPVSNAAPKRRFGKFFGCLVVLFLLATAAIVVLLGVPYAIETMRETQRTEPRRLPQ